MTESEKKKEHVVILTQNIDNKTKKVKSVKQTTEHEDITMSITNISTAKLIFWSWIAYEKSTKPKKRIKWIKKMCKYQFLEGASSGEVEKGEKHVNHRHMFSSVCNIIVNAVRIHKKTNLCKYFDILFSSSFFKPFK